LAERVARRHVPLGDPGPRLRAALLLAEVGRPGLGRQLFVRPGAGVMGEGFAGRIIDAWTEYLTTLRPGPDAEAKEIEARRREAGRELAAALRQSDLVAALRAGPYGWTDAELASLERVAEYGK